MAIILLCWFTAVAPLAEAKRGGPKKKSPWWEAIEAIDQATAPADDFIPYDWLKKKAHEYGIKPVARRWEAKPGAQHGPKWQYVPKPSGVQRTQRDSNLQKHQGSIHRNKPATPADLDALPDSPHRPGGSDVAPAGDWQPIKKPTSMSFGDWSQSLIQKHLDPSQQTGALKLLDTAQTFQHLIKCKREGTSARDCLKAYSLGFATSKAATELLIQLGRWGGAKFLTGRAYYAQTGAALTQYETAQLGGSVASGGAAVLFLAYADYKALVSIMECTTEARAWWRDYQKNLTQQLANEATDASHWDGTLRDMDRRLRQFQLDFETYLEKAGEELLGAWDKSMNGPKALQPKVDAVERALRQLMTPAEFRKKLDEACKEQGLKPGAQGVDASAKALAKKLDELKELLGQAGPLANKCDTDKKKRELGELHFKAKGLNRDLKAGIKLVRDKLGQSNKALKEAMAKAGAGLLDQVSRCPEVKAAFEDFEKVYFEVIDNTLVAAQAYFDYQRLRTVMLGRFGRLSLFYTERGKEVLSQGDLDQAKRKLEALRGKLKAFLPQRRHYDQMTSYDRDIQRHIKELSFMDGLGSRTKKAITERLAELKKVKPKCAPSAPVSKLDRWERERASLETRVNKLPGLIKKCTNKEDVRRMKCKLLAADYKSYMRDLARPGRKLSPSQRQEQLAKAAKVRSRMKKLNCTEKDLLPEDLRQAQEDCQKLSGGMVREDSTTKRAQCVCPKGSVRVKTKSRGLACVPCSQMKAYYDGAKSSGNLERARKILDKSQACSWAPAAREQLNQADQAENKCQEERRGSLPVTGPDGRIECQCPQGTAPITSQKQGARCEDCQKLKAIYDQALADGKTGKAQLFAKLARACAWSGPAQEGIDREAQRECDRKLTGSRPALLPNGKNACVCPDGVMAPRPDGGSRCVSCPELLNLVNQAGVKSDVAALQRLVPLAKNCRWYQNALNQTNQMIQRQNQAQQACYSLHQQISMACQARQWNRVKQLSAQANRLPGCKMDQWLAASCAMMHAASNPALTEAIKNTRRSRQPPPRGGGPKPGGNKPAGTPGQGSDDGFSGYFAVRYVSTTSGVNGTYRHDMVACHHVLTRDPQPLMQKLRGGAPANTKVTLVGGPYPNRSSCPARKQTTTRIK
jgi:hypothetical protein